MRSRTSRRMPQQVGGDPIRQTVPTHKYDPSTLEPAPTYVDEPAGQLLPLYVGQCQFPFGCRVRGMGPWNFEVSVRDTAMALGAHSTLQLSISNGTTLIAMSAISDSVGDASALGHRRRLPSGQRREALLDVAAARIAELGVEVSLDQLAASAGVSPPLMRHYFRNRDGLLEALFERDVAASLQILANPSRGPFEQYFTRYLEYVSVRPWAHRLWVSALSHESRLTPRAKRARQRLMETTLGKPLDELNADERTLVIAWTGAVEATVTQWLDDDRDSPAAAAGRIARLARAWGIPAASNRPPADAD